MIYINNQKIDEARIGGDSGGSTPFDFASIGYTGNEGTLKKDLEYSKKIYNEWDATQTDLSNKFKENNILIYMPLVDTSKVTNMSYMFYRTNRIIVPQLDTSKVTDMSHMFEYCSFLELPQLDTSKVTNMSYMFSYSFLEAMPQLNTSKVTDMSHMFSACKLKEIPNLNTSNVINMNHMFSGSIIQTIPQLDTSKVTDMTHMFSYCRDIQTIPQLDTSKVTYMNHMFSGCDKITKSPIIDISSCTDISDMFAGCALLTEVWFKGNPSSEIITSSMFGGQWDNLPDNGVLYYDYKFEENYLKIKNELNTKNKTWTAQAWNYDTNSPA